MKLKVFLSALVLVIPFFLNAQKPVYQTYDWDDVTFPGDSITEGKYNIKNTDIIEFLEEEGYFVEYRLKHVIELINSDEQIQLNNKKYLPMNENSELTLAKVRLIRPDGSELLLDESKILTAQDETTGAYYRYFAIEGLEPGSIIDYFYVIKKYPEYNGNRILIQDEFPTEEYNFELYCPSHLDFHFRVYNFDDEYVEMDLNATGCNHWTLKLKNIPGLKYEESSPYNALLGQVAYKIDENYSNQTADMTSFGAISQNTYSRISPELSKKEIKELEDFYKDAGIPVSASKDQVISAIEDHVKDNINIVPNNDTKYSEIGSAISSKSANATGIVRVLVAMYRLAGVECEIVLTSDRTSCYFDADFESYHYITDYLLYFPETGGFIAPDLFEYRYGIIPPGLTGNQGLFIKGVALGPYKTGIGEVKFIPFQDHDRSYHNTEATVKIAGDFESVDLHMRSLNMGQYAVYLQPYYDMINEEMKKQVLDQDYRQYFSEGEIADYHVENGNASFVGKAPFITDFTATGITDLIDRAGGSYLLKVGKLIGPQVELYSEDERKLTWDDGYRRLFDRTITIEIPGGYILKNPEALNIYADYTKEGARVIMFRSQFTVDGQKIVIDVHEYYDQVIFETDEYEAYRKVVNSAADFEKVVLVFEKAL